jgi:hypothetical protein
LQHTIALLLPIYGTSQVLDAKATLESSSATWALWGKEVMLNRLWVELPSKQGNSRGLAGIRKYLKLQIFTNPGHASSRCRDENLRGLGDTYRSNRWWRKAP